MAALLDIETETEGENDHDVNNEWIDVDVDIETHSDEELKVSTLTEIECDCGFSAHTHTLYYCNNPQCGSRIYCTECGSFYHRPTSKKYHPFEVIEINALIKKTQDPDEYQSGKEQLVALIGIARYNKIAKYIKFTTNMSLGCMRNGTNAVAIIQEVKLLLESTSSVVAAANATSEASKAIVTAVDKASEATQAIEAMKTAVDKLNIAYIQETNPSYLAQANNWLWNKCGYDTTSGLIQYEKAAEIATQKATELKSQAETANIYQNLQIEKATTATRSATDTMKNSLKSGGLIVATLTAAEMCYHTLRYYKNEISGRELCRLSGKALCRNIGSLAGSAIGGQIGIVASTNLVALGATASVCGLGIGIVGGMFLGYYLGKSAESVYEAYFPPEEELAKKQLLAEALLYFQLEEEDIKNPQFFNEKALQKEFKRAALKAHPDRNGGSSAKWYKLSMYYGVLKGLLEQNETGKEIAQNIMIEQRKIQSPFTKKQ